MSDSVPSDPLSPVLSWYPLFSASKITSLPREIPGIWIGNGLEASGIEPMSETSPDHLEQLVAEQGACELVLLEPEELPGTLARWGVARTDPKAQGAYLQGFTAYAALTVPSAMQQVWDDVGEDLHADECAFAVSMWLHPVSTCWPVPTDAWHAHCLVLGNVWHAASHD
jgi:hypothetical protein